MSVENLQNNPNEQQQLVSDLQHLLEKQIDLAHQGDIGKVELMGKCADDLAKKIAQAEILEQDAFKADRKRLRSLYMDLCLSLTAQRAETDKELSRIRKGRKTIKAYRSNT